MTSVLEEPTFSIPSGPASSCRKLAERLLSWMSEHPNAACKTETGIVNLLSSCLNQQHSNSRVRREKMWSAYHTLRISEEYISAWKSFLAPSGCSFLPLFCQHVGHCVFKELVKRHHPTPETPQHKETSFDPTYEELNGIRYAAGWVARALQKKLKKSAHPLKDDISLCIVDILDDKDDCPQESNEWVKAVDRGGLTRVNNITYELFWTMEKTLRDIMSTTPVSRIPERCIDQVKSNDDVQFVWCLMSSDWAEASADALLEMIIAEWIKIRGFSYASAWVEKYKSQQCKTTQRQKGSASNCSP